MSNKVLKWYLHFHIPHYLFVNISRLEARRWRVGEMRGSLMLSLKAFMTGVLSTSGLLTTSIQSCLTSKWRTKYVGQILLNDPGVSFRIYFSALLILFYFLQYYYIIGIYHLIKWNFNIQFVFLKEVTILNFESFLAKLMLILSRVSSLYEFVWELSFISFLI